MGARKRARRHVYERCVRGELWTEGLAGFGQGDSREGVERRQGIGAIALRVARLEERGRVAPS